MTEDSISPPSLTAFVSDRVHERLEHKSLTEIARDAGFRSADLLTKIVAGTAKLPLDRVSDVARALECDANELMRLALPQFMEGHVVQLVLSAGAAHLERKLDRMGTSLVGVATNLRIAVQAMDRTSGVLETLTEMLGRDIERFNDLCVEIEKWSSELTGYPGTAPCSPAEDQATT